MPLKTRVRELRTALANRRTGRLAHRRLSAELASFQSPSQRAELDVMLSRHTAQETAQIRGILIRQDYERLRTAAGLRSSGYRA